MGGAYAYVFAMGSPRAAMQKYRRHLSRGDMVLSRVPGWGLGGEVAVSRATSWEEDERATPFSMVSVSFCMIPGKSSRIFLLLVFIVLTDKKSVWVLLEAKYTPVEGRWGGFVHRAKKAFATAPPRPPRLHLHDHLPGDCPGKYPNQTSPLPPLHACLTRYRGLYSTLGGGI